MAETAVCDVVGSGVGTGFSQTSGWLFPGLPLTKPRGPTALSERLGPLLPGNIRGHRNTALLTLASEVPPVVVADLLGLHPNTIERWRVLPGGSPATYAAAHLHNAQADDARLQAGQDKPTRVK